LNVPIVFGTGPEIIRLSLIVKRLDEGGIRTTVVHIGRTIVRSSALTIG
jgi:UDP-N-acetylglucosamine 2-epimerase